MCYISSSRFHVCIIGCRIAIAQRCGRARLWRRPSEHHKSRTWTYNEGRHVSLPHGAPTSSMSIQRKISSAQQIKHKILKNLHLKTMHYSCQQKEDVRFKKQVKILWPSEINLVRQQISQYARDNLKHKHNVLYLTTILILQRNLT